MVAGALVPPPEIAAALAAAAETWLRATAADRPARAAGAGGHDPRRSGHVWRFSGRWWQGRVALGRDRPLAPR